MASSNLLPVGPLSLFSSGVVVQKHSSDETGPEGKHTMRAYCRQKETVIQPVLTPCFHSWSKEEGAESRLESVGSSGNSLRLDLCLLIRGGFLGVLFTSLFAVPFSFSEAHFPAVILFFFFFWFRLATKEKQSKAGPSLPVCALLPRLVALSRCSCACG